MKVHIVVLGVLPPRLARSVLAGLPRPYEVGGVEESRDDLGRCYDRARAQTDAACLLDHVPRAAAGDMVLGLTALDLFLPPLVYVFGLTPLGERRGVLSCARLASPEGGEEAAEALARRTVVESVHELGHALGLVHCPVTDCAMHRSLWPEAVDLKRPAYCPSCAAELDRLVAPP